MGRLPASFGLIDRGAKAEIYQIILNLAASGTTVYCLASGHFDLSAGSVIACAVHGLILLLAVVIDRLKQR